MILIFEPSMLSVVRRKAAVMTMWWYLALELLQVVVQTVESDGASTDIALVKLF